MQTLSFDVSGMTCGGCTASVERTLKKMKGVSRVSVTLVPAVATVVLDENLLSPAQVELTITELGFPAKARSMAHDDRSGR